MPKRRPAQLLSRESFATGKGADLQSPAVQPRMRVAAGASHQSWSLVLPTRRGPGRVVHPLLRLPAPRPSSCARSPTAARSTNTSTACATTRVMRMVVGMQRGVRRRLLMVERKAAGPPVPIRHLRLRRPLRRLHRCRCHHQHQHRQQQQHCQQHQCQRHPPPHPPCPPLPLCLSLSASPHRKCFHLCQRVHHELPLPRTHLLCVVLQPRVLLSHPMQMLHPRVQQRCSQQLWRLLLCSLTPTDPTRDLTKKARAASRKAMAQWLCRMR